MRSYGIAWAARSEAAAARACRPEKVLLCGPVAAAPRDHGTAARDAGRRASENGRPLRRQSDREETRHHE